jgi:hypothetical protein
MIGSLRIILALWILSVNAPAQVLHLKPAEPVAMPVVVDSNSPAFWWNGQLRIFSSAGNPLLHIFDSDMKLTEMQEVTIDTNKHFPMWIESVWEDGSGKLYAWYHHEQINLCPGSTLNVPQIGALISHDGGRSFTDLGIVLESGEPTDCSAQNGFFAGGHGDFSVIMDQNREYVYFLFSSYGGDLTQQGVSIARMSAAALDNPIGAVWKYYGGFWSEPGLHGQATPIFPASVPWQSAETDALWGPSIHWNTYLRSYVVLLNRSCCSPDWPQEGVYLSVAADLSDPLTFTAPTKILDGGEWYPWVLGSGSGETSSTAGQHMRLFLRDTSHWELSFYLPEDLDLDRLLPTSNSTAITGSVMNVDGSGTPLEASVPR